MSDDPIEDYWRGRNGLPSKSGWPSWSHQWGREALEQEQRRKQPTNDHGSGLGYAALMAFAVIASGLDMCAQWVGKLSQPDAVVCQGYSRGGCDGDPPDTRTPEQRTAQAQYDQWALSTAVAKYQRAENYPGGTHRVFPNDPCGVTNYLETGQGQIRPNARLKPDSVYNDNTDLFGDALCHIPAGTSGAAVETYLFADKKVLDAIRGLGGHEPLVSYSGNVKLEPDRPSARRPNKRTAPIR